ncbi:hypothetical protein DL738_11795 [Escherichia coli]|nr:hypothetical protein [Salmonella enterica]EGE2353527.1 hypothetical protein [Escherichia coli]
MAFFSLHLSGQEATLNVSSIQGPRVNLKKLLGAFCFLPQSNSESAGWGKSLQHRCHYTTLPP